MRFDLVGRIFRDMIEVQHLVKRFPHKDKAGRAAFKTAVDDLTLCVGNGEIFEPALRRRFRQEVAVHLLYGGST